MVKMIDNNYHDIKLIEKVDTRVNFIIKCESEQELSQLLNIFNTKKKMITYGHAVNQLCKDS